MSLRDDEHHALVQLIELRDIVSAIECLVQDARNGIKAAMNAIMLQTYWRTGEYIVEYEQSGADRAVYGDGLMRRLARDLTLRLGRGFSHANLIYMRKLYIVSQKSQTSDLFQKSQTSGFLTWSHYLEILRAGTILRLNCVRPLASSIAKHSGKTI